MTLEMKRSYFSSLYHNIRKKLLTNMKNKFKIQVAEKTKMLIQAYNSMLADDGSSLITSHPLSNMCLSNQQRSPWGY
jgi:hypothetical protein